MLSIALPSMLSSTLPNALDDTLPACLTIRPQVSSQNALKRTPEDALQYTPNRTRWHAPSLLDYMLPCKLSRCSQPHSRACSQVYSQLPSMAHSQPAWLYAPKYALKTLPRTPPSTHPSTPPSRSQVQSQEGRHSQSDLTICSHVRSCMLDPETCWVAEARHQEAWGRWHMVGSVWQAACGVWCVTDGRRHMVAEIIVWTLSLAHPLWQDLTMPHGHGVENCNRIFRSKGRQFKLGESRSLTQVFQRNRLPASHWLWAYVCAFGLGLMELMARAMAMAIAMAMAMAIVMVLVIVIIVQEVLRQVGWLRQSQHQSFHRLRAFH